MPALTLFPAQRADLRSEAHALKPVVLVGAEGLTDAVLKEIEVHLEAHQLIKIRVFGDERDARIEIYDEICDRLDVAPVQHIGKLLVIGDPKAPCPRSVASRAPAAPCRRARPKPPTSARPRAARRASSKR